MHYLLAVAAEFDNFVKVLLQGIFLHWFLNILTNSLQWGNGAVAESQENISNFKETSGQVLINGALYKLPSAEFWTLGT